MGTIFFYIIYLSLAVIALILLTLLFCLTWFFDKQRVALHLCSGFFCKLLYRLNPFWSMEVQGEENIDKSKAYVVVVNHQSMFDIPTMYYVPLNFKWVSKKEVIKWPIFGWILLLHGDILIERGSRDSLKVLLKKGNEKLEAGTSVIVFPEGTRSRTGKVGKFKDGAFILAQKTGKAILPCKMEGTGTMTKGWKFVMPHRFKITIMPEISEQEVENTPIKELKDKVRELYN